MRPKKAIVKYKYKPITVKKVVYYCMMQELIIKENRKKEPGYVYKQKLYEPYLTIDFNYFPVF